MRRLLAALITAATATVTQSAALPVMHCGTLGALAHCTAAFGRFTPLWRAVYTDGRPDYAAYGNVFDAAIDDRRVRIFPRLHRKAHWVMIEVCATDDAPKLICIHCLARWNTKGHVEFAGERLLK